MCKTFDKTCVFREQSETQKEVNQRKVERERKWTYILVCMHAVCVCATENSHMVNIARRRRRKKKEQKVKTNFEKKKGGTK